MLAVSEPGRDGVWALGGRTDEGLVVLLANLTARTRGVRIAAAGGRELTQHLPAFGTARLVVDGNETRVE
jgi:hypothetical protein